MKRYSLDTEEKMKVFYNSLSEKDKRHYAAVEATKLGHGGLKYLSELFKCTRQTISKGLENLKNNDFAQKQRTRKPGGGRKNYKQKYPSINTVFLKGN